MSYASIARIRDAIASGPETSISYEEYERRLVVEREASVQKDNPIEPLLFSYVHENERALIDYLESAKERWSACGLMTEMKNSDVFEIVFEFLSVREVECNSDDESEDSDYETEFEKNIFS